MSDGSAIQRPPLDPEQPTGQVARGHARACRAPLLDDLAQLLSILIIAVICYLALGCDHFTGKHDSAPQPPPPSEKVPDAPAPDNTIKQPPPDLGQKPSPPPR
ncbi:MAG: hypothetical protein AB7G11_06420 [Phycisphaerales bacterium]